MKSALVTIALVTVLSAICASSANVTEETLAEPTMDTVQMIPEPRQSYSRDVLRALGAERATDLQRKVFTYNASVYSDWTSWSDCSPYSCKQRRFRQCLDESFNKSITYPRRRNFCPFKFITEEIRCPDTSRCLENAGPSKTLRRLAVTCGIRPATAATQRGAPPARGNKWPWHVRLYKEKRPAEEGRVKTNQRGDTDVRKEEEEAWRTHHAQSDQQLVCGGSLISPSWIVTSVHCLRTILQSKTVPLGQPFNFTGMVARVGGGGQQQRRPQQASSLGTEYRIELAVLHPDWYPRFHGQSGFDIVLLKLAVPVSPDEADVDTICLADANTTLAKTDKCFVVGWGLGGTSSPCTVKGMPYRHLRGGAHGRFRRHYGLADCRYTRSHRQREPLSAMETRVTPAPLKKCVRSRLHPNKDHLICAGGAGRTVCTGDHGSSLYCLNSKTDRWFLHGVTGQHWRHRCSDAYSLFNSVPSVADWIHQHIQ